MCKNGLLYLGNDTMLNWQSDRVLIVYYPPGAGGNFVANALALSDSVEAQDVLLLNIPYEDKVKSLFERSKEFDFFTGIEELFGLNIYQVSNDKLRKCEYSQALVNVSYSKKYWTVNCHTELHLEKLLQLFPNAKILKLENYEDFCVKRGYTLANYHSTEFRKYAGADWKDLSFNNMPSDIQQEIKEKYPQFIPISLNRDVLCASVLADYYFDVGDYSEEPTLFSLEKLYKELEIPKFNRSLIKDFYTLWKNRINDTRT